MVSKNRYSLSKWMSTNVRPRRCHVLKKIGVGVAANDSQKTYYICSSTYFTPNFENIVVRVKNGHRQMDSRTFKHGTQTVCG